MRFIRRKELLEWVGLSYVHILRLEKAGSFPKRVNIGPGATAWVEAEIEEWMEARVALRDTVRCVAPQHRAKNSAA